MAAPGESVTRGGARVRVAAHVTVVLGLVAAVVSTVATGDVLAAAACVLAAVFFVDARRTEAALGRAERRAVEAAETFAAKVRERCEQTLDLAVAAAVQALPQEQADEMVLAVLAHRESLHPEPQPDPDRHPDPDSEPHPDRHPDRGAR